MEPNIGIDQGIVCYITMIYSSGVEELQLRLSQVHAASSDCSTLPLPQSFCLMNLKNLWHFIRLQVNQLQLQLQLICNASGLRWGLLSTTTAAAATPQAQQQLLPVLSGDCLVMLISIRCDCSPLRPRVCSRSRSQLQPRLVGGRHKDLSFTHSLTHSHRKSVGFKLKYQLRWVLQSANQWPNNNSNNNNKARFQCISLITKGKGTKCIRSALKCAECVAVFYQIGNTYWYIHISASPSAKP